MLLFSFVLVLCVFKAESFLQNVSCPVITPMKLDLKEIDGKWYMIAIASEWDIESTCSTVTFSHKTYNTTDITVSNIRNNTARLYKGSVVIGVDNFTALEGDVLLVTYTDNKTESYSFLALDYEHYAVMFSCHNSPDGNDSSTYQLWELSRTPHVKPEHLMKISKVLAMYNLQDTPMLLFNNTEDTCRVNSGVGVSPSSSILTSAAALSVLRRLY